MIKKIAKIIAPIAMMICLILLYLTNFNYINGESVYINLVIQIVTLVFLVCIYLMLARKSLQDEATHCINSAVRKLLRIKNNPKVKLMSVRIFAAKNNINFGIYYLEQLLRESEIYDLDSVLKRLQAISKRYDVFSTNIEKLDFTILNNLITQDVSELKGCATIITSVFAEKQKQK